MSNNLSVKGSIWFFEFSSIKKSPKTDLFGFLTLHRDWEISRTSKYEKPERELNSTQFFLLKIYSSGNGALNSKKTLWNLHRCWIFAYLWRLRKKICGRSRKIDKYVDQISETRIPGSNVHRIYSRKDLHEELGCKKFAYVSQIVFNSSWHNPSVGGTVLSGKMR